MTTTRAIETCPKCGASPFRTFLRGQVRNFLRKWIGMKSWAVICWDCKNIVAYERERPPVDWFSPAAEGREPNA